MNELLLRSYETFFELPEGMLLVTQKSNLMYVRIGRFTFVAREFVDSISNDNDNLIYKICYLNVKNNSKILELELIKDFNNNETKIINKNNNVEIIPLSKILNIDGNKVLKLTIQDIDDLLNYKEEFIPGKKISLI